MEKKSLNSNLHKASKAKKDEFYTQLVDIEKELKHYKEQFKGKVVYCNCDDPFESNFFKFFAANFNAYKLKKLIATSYSGSPIIGGQLSLFDIKGLKQNNKQPIKIEINKVSDSDASGSTDIADIEWLLKNDSNVAIPLKESGDFRSRECIELLKQADIVVTNPPFSLFREYVAQLVEYDKKFLILGNKNAITYKEIFKLIKENRLWVGMMSMGYDILFYVPDEYAKSMIEKGKEGSQYKIINGVVYGRSPSIWFTNLDTTKRHERMMLYKKFSPEQYPKYDNYNAIEVSKVVDIPLDYTGAMGVPITFLDKYNPEQFEIIKFRKGDDNKDLSIKGKYPFFRILIRNKKLNI